MIWKSDGIYKSFLRELWRHSSNLSLAFYGHFVFLLMSFHFVISVSYYTSLPESAFEEVCLNICTIALLLSAFIIAIMHFVAAYSYHDDVLMPGDCVFVQTSRECTGHRKEHLDPRCELLKQEDAFTSPVHISSHLHKSYSGASQMTRGQFMSKWWYFSISVNPGSGDSCSDTRKDNECKAETPNSHLWQKYKRSSKAEIPFSFPRKIYF